MTGRRVRALDTLIPSPMGDYQPNYPQNAYRVQMTEAEKIAEGKDSRWLEDLRRMVQIGGGKVIVKEEKGDNAVITVNHPWGHNMGNLSIPKSALKKAQFQLVTPEPMIQPLRRRRDYGEIEAEIVKRMKEAKIASRVAAGTWKGVIERDVWNPVFDANQKMAQARDNALATYRRLGQLQKITQNTFMSEDKKAAQLKIIDDVRRQIFDGTMKIKKAMDVIVGAGTTCSKAADMASGLE